MLSPARSQQTRQRRRPFLYSLLMTPDPPADESWRSPAQRAALLVPLAAAVFFLPYLVPVKPSVSLAYVAGFSNRAAVLLLLGGGAAFALFTPRPVCPAGEQGLPSRPPHTPLIACRDVRPLSCPHPLYPAGRTQ